MRWEKRRPSFPAEFARAPVRGRGGTRAYSRVDRRHYVPHDARRLVVSNHCRGSALAPCHRLGVASYVGRSPSRRWLSVALGPLESASGAQRASPAGSARHGSQYESDRRLLWQCGRGQLLRDTKARNRQWPALVHPRRGSRRNLYLHGNLVQSELPAFGLRLCQSDRLRIAADVAAANVESRINRVSTTIWLGG